MTKRARNWIIGLAVADVIVLALTIHEAVTWHRTPGSPSVAPLSELVGWVFAAVLTILLGVVTKESRRS